MKLGFDPAGTSANPTWRKLSNVKYQVKSTVKVTATVTPKDGYGPTKDSMQGNTLSAVQDTTDSNKFTFEMPDADATLQVKCTSEWQALGEALAYAAQATPVTVNAIDYDFNGDKHITAQTGDSGLVVGQGADVTLNLGGVVIDGNGQLGDSPVIAIPMNGNTLTIEGDGRITGGNNTGEGSGVYVGNGATLILNGCEITGNKAKNGGGVYVSNNATLSLNGGTITGNKAVNGGGVYVDDIGNHPVKLSGTKITGNRTSDGKADSNVALAWMNKSQYAMFQITGDLTGAIGVSYVDVPLSGLPDEIQFTSGLVSRGGARSFVSELAGYGVYVKENGEAVLGKDEWKSLQSALSNGGAVNAGDFDFADDDKITAADDDTALLIPAGKDVALDLKGVTIDRGLANKNAVANGSVTTVYGNLTLTGTGTITGGNTNGNGGGVLVDNGGAFTMTGGTITGNKARGYGGGVYVRENATFKLSGSPAITGNTAKGKDGNVTLAWIDAGNCAKINIAGRLNNSAPIGVGYDDDGFGDAITFTTDLTANADGKASHFKSEMTGCDVYMIGNEAVLGKDEWKCLQNALANGGEVKAGDFDFNGDGEINATGGDTALRIPAGRTVTLDLDGKKIDRKLSAVKAGGSVLTVYGKLTLNGTGTITGGNNRLGGGVFVSGVGAAITGGAITKNTAVCGGGVFAYRDFRLSGSPDITGNKEGDGDGNVALAWNGASDCAKIDIADTLGNTSPIGVALPPGGVHDLPGGLGEFEQ